MKRLLARQKTLPSAKLQLIFSILPEDSFLAEYGDNWKIMTKSHADVSNFCMFVAEMFQKKLEDYISMMDKDYFCTTNIINKSIQITVPNIVCNLEIQQDDFGADGIYEELSYEDGFDEEKKAKVFNKYVLSQSLYNKAIINTIKNFAKLPITLPIEIYSTEIGEIGSAVVKFVNFEVSFSK